MPAAGTGEATASDRLLATLMGAALAFIAIAIGRMLLGRPLVGGEAEPPAEDANQTPG